jgi:hypothetical protein
MSEAFNKAGLLYLDNKPGSEFDPLLGYSDALGLFTYAAMALPKVHEEEMRAKVAWKLDTYWRERGSPNSLLTLKGLQKTLHLLQNSFPGLCEPGAVKLGKKQPSLLESIDATIRRIDFLCRYVRKLDYPYLSVISGGSMSYGRFYNVRDGEDPSDLDLIIVYDQDETDALDAKQIMPCEVGFSLEDIKLLQERIGVFLEMHKNGHVDVLSQKADIEKEGFSVSIHLMSAATLENMLVVAPHIDLRNGKDTVKQVRDYKPAPFKHQDVLLHNFLGEPNMFNVNEQKVRNGVLLDEVVTQIPSHAIVDGLFIPGLYHNLISPRYEMMEAFSARECVAAATLFWNLMRRLEKVYRRTYGEKASALRSHIRYEIFNPELIKEHERNN